MSAYLYSPAGLMRRVGERAQARRLANGERQVDLADRAGVTVSTLRRFEAGRNVGFDAIVKIALALHAEAEVAQMFSPLESRSLDDLLRSQVKRLRGRA